MTDAANAVSRLAAVESKVRQVFGWLDETQARWPATREFCSELLDAIEPDVEHEWTLPEREAREQYLADVEIERDRARATAANLEQQLAEIERIIHGPEVEYLPVDAVCSEIANVLNPELADVRLSLHTASRECRDGQHVFPQPVHGGSPCACGSLRVEGEDVSGGCFVSAVVWDSPTGERVTVAVREPAVGEGSA